MFKGFTVAPTFFYRSPLPVQTIQGVDANLNGENNDLPAQGLPVHGRRRGAEGDRRLRDLELQPRRVAHAGEPARCPRASTCSAARASRRSPRSFNLFNAKNPGFTIVNNQTSALFMQPNAFAGDFQQPEQRVGQIGFRFSF